MEINLFGGFEVRSDQRRETGFESQKVRGLLAYLALHEGRTLSRDQIAAVLWPDVDGASARRNLRQALYNLRQALPELGETVSADHQSVSFRSRSGDRVDVIDFLTALRRGLPGGDEVLVAPLRGAVELYRGDLLAGFFVHESPAFEEWLVTEQERLRDAMLRALGALVDHLAARGEYQEAVVHARKRVEVDPLSEESHRELMRLYVLAGRRRRALAQFDELSQVLARELGVEPLPETRELHRRILSEDLTLSAAPADAARPPLGPFVPLVGRREALAALSESWHHAMEGGARIALVEGRAGVGKTRLIKSFLNEITSGRGARVIQARCLERPPGIAEQPFLDLLHALDALDGSAAGALPGAEGGAPAAPSSTGGGEPAQALARSLLRRGDRPLVIFLDDLQWADPGTWSSIVAILDRCAALPVWLVTATDGAPPSERPAGAATDDPPRIDRLALAELEAAEVAAIAAALVGEGEAGQRLAEALAAAGGLPLAVVERINSLCDEGYLTATGRQRWTLEGDPADSPTAGLDLDRVIARRLRRLPTSARRLVALAAMIGQTFDVELLQRAAHEHVAVVEIGIELMLERWLVRQHLPRWSDSPRERDLVLWAQGARRGSFEFAHARLREVALTELAGEGRRALRRQVAHALAARAADGSEVAPDVLADHRRQAGDPATAPDQKRKRAPR